MKMKKIKILILLIFALGLNEAFSQYASFIKINEMMVRNDSTYEDDFGYRSGWIEIFNSAYNDVNIGGMFLTNDLNNPKKYFIPRNDGATKIPFQGFVVFFADNHPTRGTFHLNFSIENSEYIAIFDADGKTLIDKVEIPKDLKSKPNISFGREIDGGDKWIYEDRYTPNQTNVWQDKITKTEQIAELDSTGIGMTVVAMAVVFSALIFIFFMLKSFTIADKLKTKKIQREITEEADKKTKIKKSDETTGEVCAAIAMALHYSSNQYHDEESEIVTINKTIRPYSPWSQKHLNIIKKRR